MRRVLIALLLLVSASACLRSGDVQVVARDELPPDTYGAGVRERPTSVDFFLLEGNRLAKVTRTGTASRAAHEVAIVQLLNGPNADEVERGLSTAISAATELLDITVEGGTARVDLTEDFFRPEEKPESIQQFVLRLAQVVWTLTEINGITRVQFFENGRVEGVLDQQRQATSLPVGRSSYRNFDPRADRSLNVDRLPTI